MGVKPFVAVLCLGRGERKRERTEYFFACLCEPSWGTKYCDVCTEPQMAAMFNGCAHLRKERSPSQKAQDVTDAGYNHR